MSKLAIYGGPKTIQAGEIKPWPPIDKTDEGLVLQALHADKQARGEHNIALRRSSRPGTAAATRSLPTAAPQRCTWGSWAAASAPAITCW
jgi:hypothetical protein